MATQDDPPPPRAEDPTVPAQPGELGAQGEHPSDRSPSRQHLHDAVKAALFEGESLARDYDAGTVLGGRYRVIGLLGKGGMGEVYRARDLVIDEDVAIKFLPPGLADRPAYLERFVQEVRVARQVSHPNVCRVHDMGEVDGRRFISMEYIDGEDLQSLLRRIGRLGPEKAVELSHQLCAGVAALHERGIVHRDLKPSNIMLDGAGRIRIADFGLASVAAELTEHQYRDGTPAYQAPEQTAGREVTTRSDVYSLGMIMWELFVGERYRARDADETEPDQTDPRIDEDVRRVLQRCLRHDPAQRPESAVAIAAALPGGDPLAAALAAGRLPSPEAVANTSEVGALRPLVAYLLCALIVLSTVFLLVAGNDVGVLANSAEVEAPEVLEHRVREILETIDSPVSFAVEGTWLEHDTSVLEWANEQDEPAEALADSDLSAILFRFRGYPQAMATGSPLGAERVPLHTAFETEITLDGRGRLREFLQIPPDPSDARGTTGGTDDDSVGDGINLETVVEPRPYDWDPLFEEAGFDPLLLDPAPLRRVPPAFADSARAWKTTLGDVPVVISAASLAGRPVWFSVETSFPQEPPESVQDEIDDDSVLAAVLAGLGFVIVGAVVVVALAVVGPALAVFVRKRGDFVGARRLALLVLSLEVVAWTFGVRAYEAFNFITALLLAAGTSVLVWLLYLMVEPWVRQHWPHALVSWSRVLQGRWRDPMVGRDILLGLSLALSISAVAVAIKLLAAYGLEPAWDLDIFLGARHAFARLADSLRGSIDVALSLLVALLGLQRVFRRRMIALVVLCLAVPFMTLVVFLTGQLDADTAAELGGAMLLVLTVTVVMSRFGLLALVALLWFTTIVREFPLPLFSTDAYGSFGWLALTLIAVFAVTGYMLSTAPFRARARAAEASGTGPAG